MVVSSGGDDDQETSKGVGSGDSVEDVLCIDRRTPLVNTALGLMGYQVPQVCELMVKHWMDTAHSLLRHDSLTAPKLRRILDNVDSALRELGGSPLLELIEALLKAAIDMNNMSLKSSSGNWTFVRTKCSGSGGSDAAWAVEKILDYVLKEKEAVYNCLSPIARLQVWRLRPSLLKVDLSDLANESMRRPLLSLKVVSRSCRNFSFLVASLALAPDLLNDVRRLLLTWWISVRAVRLLELRAQLTVVVHGILQRSNDILSATSNEGVWAHSVHCSSLRPCFIQVLTGVPTISALSHLVGLMEKRESSTRTSASSAVEVIQNCERPLKQQRTSYEMADQDQSLDERLAVFNGNSRNMPGILRADKEALDMRTEANAFPATDSSKTNLYATTSGGVYNCSLWAPLADFLPWSTFASQLLFQHGNASTVSRTSAAHFLGWLMCPSSSEGRAYVVTEILQAAEDWHSIMCNEGKSSGTQVSRRPGEGLKRRNGTESFPLTLCNLCESPVSCIADCATGGPHHASSYSTFQNLVAWLLRLCSLGRELQLLHLKGGKSVSSHQRNGMWRVIRVLPTGFLASESSILTPEVGSLLLSMVLLGLTSGSRKGPSSKEKSSPPRSCCTVCEDLHCVSCCSKDRHKSSEPPHRTEHIKDDAARIEEEDDLDWVPFAGALLTHLDTIFFATSSAPCAEPKSLLSDDLSVRRVVAACVRHWVRVVVGQSTGMMSSGNVEIMLYHRRIQMLEDLHTRVGAWADAIGADAELAQSLGDLQLQVEQLKTFL